MKHLSPAEYVIHVYGGVRATARAIGRTAPAVSRWRKSRRNGGTGGRIPMKVQCLILAHAHKNSVDIKADDFTKGRRVEIPKKPIWER